MTEYFDNTAIGLFLVRVVTGILFLFQGYDKIYRVKLPNVVRTFSGPMEKTVIPMAMLRPAVSVSSWLELICGVLLIIGLFRDVALYLLAADLIFVAFAFSSMRAMWDMQFFLPRILFVTLLLIVPGEADCLRVDSLY